MGYFLADKITGKSIKILSESDPKGWLENHKQIRFLKDGELFDF